MSLKTFELLGVLECSLVRFAATEVSLPPGIRSGLVCVEEQEEEDEDDLPWYNREKDDDEEEAE